MKKADHHPKVTEIAQLSLEAGLKAISWLENAAKEAELPVYAEHSFSSIA